MTEEEYQTKCQRIEQLIDDPDALEASPELSAELDRLADEVIAYEEEHFPIEEASEGQENP